jgi:sarcosine oxidase, subunit gamma
MSPPLTQRRSFVGRRLPADLLSATDINGLKLVDLSLLPRWGVKGRGALARLAAHGATAPTQDNRAARQSDGSLIARLSPGEALVLASVRDARAAIAQAIEALPPEGHGACYPVPRRDSHCWFVVCGADAPRMFAKLCGVDLAAESFADGSVAQTSLARLSAIIIRNDIDGSIAMSILADSASAEYLWDCLIDAMAEFSGATCGVESL